MSAYGLAALAVALSAAASLGQSVITWGMGPAVVPALPGATNVIALAAGANHALGLRADGTVIAWGENNFGETEAPAGLTDAKAIAAGQNFSLALRADGQVVQWGLGPNIDTNFLFSPSDLVALSARGSHALALRKDGTVVAWGQNLYGESSVPADLSQVIAVAAGGTHSLALKSDGTVVGWGDDHYGQASVPLGLTNVVGIAAGAQHSLALQANGRVVGWGDDSAGQIKAPPGLTNAVAIAGASLHSLALRADGSIVAWGELGSFLPWDMPRASAIAAGDHFSLALVGKLPPVLPLQNGRIVDELTQLVVTNTVLDPGQPTGEILYEILGGPAGVSIDANGVIRWTPTEAQGPGKYGILVQAFNEVAGTRARRSLDVVVNEVNLPPVLPLQPSFSLSNLLEVVVPNKVTDPDLPANLLAYQLLDPPPGATIDAQGLIRWLPAAATAATNVFTTVVTDNGFPPLSATNTFTLIVPETDRAPVLVSSPRDTSVGIGRDAALTVVAVGAEPLEYQWRFMGADLPGATTSTLTLPNAQVSQSGPYNVIVKNGYGSLTSPTVQLSVQGVVAWGWSSYEILNAPSTVTNVVALSAGKIHNLALRADGTVVAWGSNIGGACDVPPGLNDVVAIAAGNGFSLALKSNGTVVGWGSNAEGDLDIPIGLNDAVAISTLQGSSFAIRADGTVVGWGKLNQTIPQGLTNVVAIASGREHTLVLKADGSLMAWDNYGSVPSPVFVPDVLTNVVAVAASIVECLALRADGTVVTWGSDSSGKFTRFIPVSDVVAISSFGGHSLALRADGTVVQWGTLNYGDVPQPMDLRDVVAIAAGGYQSLALLRDGAPHLTVQPQDQTVAQNGRSFFATKAVGLQSMSYQWRFNGQDIPGATNDTYAISQAQPTDAGQYSLIATNPKGQRASRLAKLTVLHSGPDTNSAPILLRLLSATSDGLQFQLNGDLGRDFILESSAELQNWTNLQTRHPDSMPFIITVPNLGAPSQFFRVRLGQSSGE